jgi:ribose transport system substrate-binding protein
MTGVPEALFAEQMEEAHKKGIQILSCFGADEPSPTGYLAQCGSTKAEEDNGELLADWAIGNAEGKANVLAVNIPDYPTLVSQEEGFKARLAQNCPECSIESLGVTIEALAEGKVPQAIASKLQSDPSINYIYYTMSDLPGGVYETLAGAGLNENVTQFGLDFNQERLEEIEEGKIEVASGLAKEYSAWLLFHFAALNAEGQKIENLAEAELLPAILVGKEQAHQYMSTRYQWPGPEGFQEQFEALWHVGG